MEDCTASRHTLLISSDTVDAKADAPDPSAIQPSSAPRPRSFGSAPAPPPSPGGAGGLLAVMAGVVVNNIDSAAAAGVGILSALCERPWTRIPVEIGGDDQARARSAGALGSAYRRAPCRGASKHDITTFPCQRHSFL